MKEKIRFRDLSFWLKIAVVGAWIFLAYFITAILTGKNVLS